MHQVVNEGPHLLMTETKDDDGPISKAAKKERGRRAVERRLYEQLSRHYPRAKGVWTRPELLSKGDHGRILCIGDIPLIRFSYQWCRICRITLISNNLLTSELVNAG